jgi:hypothetical protein
MEDFSNNNDESVVSKINEIKKERNEVLKDIEITLTKQKEIPNLKKNKIITKVNTPKLEDSNDDSNTSEEEDSDDEEEEEEEEEKERSNIKKKLVKKFTANSSNKKKIIDNDSDDSE